MDKAEATSIAQELLDRYTNDYGSRLLVTDVEEAEFSWVVRYGMENGDVLIGVGPILIDKFNGSIQQCGSAFSSQQYVQKYDQLRKSGRPVDIGELQHELVEQEDDRMRPEIEKMRLHRKLTMARKRG